MKTGTKPKTKPHSMVEGVVYIDNRVGSREFADTLHRRFALKISVERMEFGDFAFLGNGPNGPLRIGIERKTVGDLVGSLLKNRLYGHQIPGLLADYDIVWLVVEGVWRPARESELIEVRGVDYKTRKFGWVPARLGVTHPQLSRWLFNFDFNGGGRLKRWRTMDEYDTAHFVHDQARYLWKPWKKHNAHAAIGKWKPGDVPQKVMLDRPADIVRVAASLPGVGQDGARRFGRHFKSIRAMVNAGEEEFVGAGMKPKNAEKLWFQMRRRLR